jgi:hypothetical protein
MYGTYPLVLELSLKQAVKEISELPLFGCRQTAGSDTY